MRKKLFTFLLATVAGIGILQAEVYSGTCGDNLTWELNTEDSTLTISGTGTMPNYSYSSSPWYSSRSIITSVVINEGVTSIGHSAFYRCSSLTSVTIPNSVTSIGDEAFYGCESLTSVTIPNSVTSIGTGTFYGIIGLTSVTIPNSVTSIGSIAFALVPNIVYSGTATGSPWGARSVNGYEDGWFVYADASKTSLLACSTIAQGEIVIPNSVTSIGVTAFVGCRGLTSVTIPNSVTSIGDGAFLNCSGLTSLTIGNSVTSIGMEAFSSCSSLTSVTIPNSVTSIETGAFSGCRGLTSVTIGNSVTSIGSRAFSDVPNIVYSGTATGSPWGARSVNGYVEGWVVYADASKTSLLACSTAAQGEIVIPNSVTSIGWRAFEKCDGLTSVTIPNSVTSIGDRAFSDCSSLTSVTIPNSVTSIGENAFWYCTGLTSLTIGNSVTSIGDAAFMYCDGLTSITCLATTLPMMGYNVFYYVDESIPLYVPAGSVSAYQSADQWKDFSNILPIGAQPADVTTTTVTPSATTADIAWPQVTGAATYTIEIKKNGELICTLTFNAQGQLQSIAFNAPSRNNAPQQAQAAGFAFTVTSLDSGTTYSYTMTAKGNNGNVLKTESGSFTTTGDAQGIEDVQGNNVQCTKIVRDGHIYILRDGKAYTLTGQLVR